MDTEPYPVVAGLLIRGINSHVILSRGRFRIPKIRNGYEYGRRSCGRFRIPPAIVAIIVYDYFMK